jgi:hypothetical protein
MFAEHYTYSDSSIITNTCNICDSIDLEIIHKSEPFIKNKSINRSKYNSYENIFKISNDTLQIGYYIDKTQTFKFNTNYIFKKESKLKFQNVVKFLNDLCKNKLITEENTKSDYYYMKKIYKFDINNNILESMFSNNENIDENNFNDNGLEFVITKYTYSK